jgi:di- and tripeptidase
VRHNNENLFIAGANDNLVSVWRVPEERGREDRTDDQRNKDKASLMVASLGEFVSYKTISSRPEYAEDCRQGATFLGALFKKLGGQVEMLKSDEARNPVVLATFRGKLEPAEKRRRVLFYGHYDVVPADGKKGNWVHEPFHMKGHNGYLHGRGVSDNKGPIMAALYATADLMQAKALENDIVFLIEGEEESGSRGFAETVRKNKALIGRVDYILLANSYWLDDEVPCLTYGLRGVLHATAEVRSPHADKHSGVDGSRMLDEPLSDLTRVLGALKGNKNRVMLPGFYDCVLPVTDEEEARYDDIASILLRRSSSSSSKGTPPATAAPTTAAALKQTLMARWREPNLTIHRYRVSGPDGSLVSAHASAHISLRLVPGQEVDEVAASLRAFLEERFAELESTNEFAVRIDNHAEPWLGEPGNVIFRTLEDAVMETWAECFDPAARSRTNSRDAETADAAAASASAAVQALSFSSSSSPSPTHAPSPIQPSALPQKPKRPLYIREGGSIPAIRFLEKEFGAPAAHLPCGQSSDSAHLDNERLRVENLLKSREIFRLVFARL